MSKRSWLLDMSVLTMIEITTCVREAESRQKTWWNCVVTLSNQSVRKANTGYGDDEVVVSSV